jgi:hypothetical protein
MVKPVDDILHRGAERVAVRLFGEATPEAVRLVRRWSSEVPESQRPDFLIKIAGRICAWESAVRRHAAARPQTGDSMDAEGRPITPTERRELRKLAKELELLFERVGDNPTLYGFGYYDHEHLVFLFISADAAVLRRWAQRRAVDRRSPAHQHAGGVP